MTCKISFFKSIRETLKHHVASIFATCLVFFIQFIVFFLNIQNMAANIASKECLDSVLYTSNNMHIDIMNKEWLSEELHSLTQPGYGYMIPVVIVAVLLAYDFFRYLHSKKQTDFYESLPLNRKSQFFLRTVTALSVFLVPYVICIGLELLLLVIFDMFAPVYFMNLLWNFVCMTLIFIIVWLTGVLAMVMTGHSLIALFGFGIFAGYAPIILRYLIDAYAVSYFTTYVTETAPYLSNLEYLSPFGATAKLLGNGYKNWASNEHVIDFIVILILIAIVGLLSYFLFSKRPAEAAGRAMAFEKANPFIRILLVVPLTLYVGLYLGLVTSTGSIAWSIFGFIIGAFLLNGIIESIFRFDIRGMVAHKKQMIFCFIGCLGFASIFWFDFVKYDSYLPKYEELQSIYIETNRSNYYANTPTDNGLTGDELKSAYKLAKAIIHQNADNTEVNGHHLTFEYRLKNGAVKKRSYIMDHKTNIRELNALYATEDFKDDFCPLYTSDWEKVIHITWNDYAENNKMLLTQKQINLLFETYLAEFTELNFEEHETTNSLGFFNVVYQDKPNEQEGEYHIYPQFVQTIALMDQYIHEDENIKVTGSIASSLFSRYKVNFIEIYTPDKSTFVKDESQIKILSEHIVLGYHGSKYADIDWEDYYELEVNFETTTVSDGNIYGFIPKEIVHKYIK